MLLSKKLDLARFLHYSCGWAKHDVVCLIRQIRGLAVIWARRSRGLQLITVILLITLTALACEPNTDVIDPGVNAATISCGGKLGQAFAIDAHRWATAAHILVEVEGDTPAEPTACTEPVLHLLSGTEPARVAVFRPEIDLAILEIGTPTAEPLELCGAPYLRQLVTHVVVDMDFELHTRDGSVARLRDDHSYNDQWQGRLVKTTAHTRGGWSGGAALGFSVGKDKTCVLGVTVASDEVPFGVTWFVPSRAIRESE